MASVSVDLEVRAKCGGCGDDLDVVEAEVPGYGQNKAAIVITVKPCESCRATLEKEP
jgi:hypothetical protein